MGKHRTVEHKSFTAPTYALVLTSLQAYLNSHPKRELISVQETSCHSIDNGEKVGATYFIVWSS